MQSMSLTSPSHLTASYCLQGRCPLTSWPLQARRTCPRSSESSRHCTRAQWKKLPGPSNSPSLLCCVSIEQTTSYAFYLCGEASRSFSSYTRWQGDLPHAALRSATHAAHTLKSPCGCQRRRRSGTRLWKSGRHCNTSEQHRTAQPKLGTTMLLVTCATTGAMK